MNETARTFARISTARDLARADLDASVARVRDDLAARGVVGRALDTVVEEAADAAFEAVDVARANKPVVVGTSIALVAWWLRAPLVDTATSLFERIRHR